MTDSATPAGQFRPISLSDFRDYAKHLAWVIDESLQRSQEMLARIYGYSGLHELQQVMKTPGTPGPFDCDWIRKVDGRLVANPEVQIAVRKTRVLDIVAPGPREVGVRIEHRLFVTMELGLFQPPDLHREAYQSIRGQLEVLDGTERDGRDRPAADYAYRDTSCEDEVLLRFTPLGKAIYDAVASLLPERAERVSDEDWQWRIIQLFEIAERHPNNPWPNGMYLYSMQTGFGEEWDDDILAFDPDPANQSEAQRDAVTLLPMVKQAITQFEDLMGDMKGKLAAPFNLVSPGSDCFTYPALLYWGAVIALTAGEPALAKRWFTRNRKYTPDDNFGARFYLRALRTARKKTATEV